MIRSLVISDIRIYREGLAAYLNGVDGIAVAGTAESRDEARLRMTDAIDVVLLDASMAHGPDIVRDLRAGLPGIPTVALSVPDGEEVMTFALVGVAGYVPREASLEDLVAAIKSAVCGEPSVPPKIGQRLLQCVATATARQAVMDELTPREVEIAEHLASGESNKEIARSLGIETSTVKNHVHNILGKLGARRRGEAAAMIRRTLRGGSIGVHVRG